MRLYLAGAESGGDHIWLDGLEDLALLVSFYYIESFRGQYTVDFAYERGIPMFLDSGAFTAFKTGADLSLTRYIQYCREQGHKFEVIASLDVIGDWQGTKINHEIMKSEGINSICTFHVRSPFERLKELVNHEDHIALGVAGSQIMVNQLMAWLIRCFKIINSVNPKCRVHGFALTSDLVMRSFPWTSVDSTLWLVARQFGRLVYVDCGRLKSRRFSEQGKRLIQRKGTKESYGPILRHNAEQMLKWTRLLTQLRSIG